MRIASPAHVIRPLQWVVLSRSLHVKATEFATFVVRVWENKGELRACLHGGGGPQVDEVTRLGEVKK